MAVTTHACPCGCGAQIARARLACRRGWYELPEELRREVNYAWRNRITAPERHTKAVRDALRFYSGRTPRGDA